MGEAGLIACHASARRRRVVRVVVGVVVMVWWGRGWAATFITLLNCSPEAVNND